MDSAMTLANPQSRPQPPAAEPFLARVATLIDWELLGDVMAAASKRTQARMPLAAVKIAPLKQWYGLADTMTESVVRDRRSFQLFVGASWDGGVTDVEILNELHDNFWGQQPEMNLLVAASEEQLRDQGITVRSGQLAEPSLVPSTEVGVPAGQTGETSLFRPGDLGRMVEAVTAKAHAQGRMPTGPQEPQNVAVSADASFSADRERLAEGPGGDEIVSQDGRVRAVLEWPWGQRSELTEHLNIGRDYTFSPLAQELTPYTHVSRKHAELLVYGDGVWIRDLGSRNGTFVNNDEVPKGQAYLIDGESIIRFGPFLAVSLKIVG